MVDRTDETQQRLLNWRSETKGAGERLTALVLAEEGYTKIDPSHPYGGTDDGRDGYCVAPNGDECIFACYFPGSKQTKATTKAKLIDDAQKAVKWNLPRLVFATGQEILLSERESYRKAVKGLGIELDLFHMESIATVLDRPHMHPVRKQFLKIDFQPDLLVDVQIGPVAWGIESSETFRERLIVVRDENRRAAAAAIPEEPAPRGGLAAVFGDQVESQPRPTAQQLDEQQSRDRTRIEQNWDHAIDYISARGLPCVEVALTNTQASFLESVELVATIQGAYGVSKRSAEFNWGKMLDPEWAPAPGPYGIPQPDYEEQLAGLRRPGPMEWRNVESRDAVEIRVNLETLRTTPPWASGDESDLIVVARDPSASALTVEWTVTARTYGVHDSGTIDLPVESIDTAAVYQAAVVQTRLQNPRPAAGTTD